eukprot:2315689-Pyramimonas_sp.AAC.1
MQGAPVAQPTPALAGPGSEHVCIRVLLGWASPSTGGTLKHSQQIAWGYVAPIVLKNHIPEIISSTQKSVETVSKQYRLPGSDT